MVLLDTCTLLWLASNPAQLSEAARDAVSSSRELCVSAISAWEIALMSSSGKLTLPSPAASWYAGILEHHGLEEIALSGSIACAATTLPRLHNDPADRFIIATAMVRGLVLITPDHHISQYPQIKVVW